ncbi:apoptosis regulator BAX-like [Pholidichthys leucotaenia]
MELEPGEESQGGEGSSSTRAASARAEMVQSSESDTEQEPSEQPDVQRDGERGPGNNEVQILERGAALQRDFIYERVHRHGDGTPVVSRDQLDGEDQLNLRRLAEVLQRIQDELDGNLELRRMIDDAAVRPDLDVFCRVAVEIFSDGGFTWGRLVTLYYFGIRLLIRLLLRQPAAVYQIIRTIIISIMILIHEIFVIWIRDQGGWEGIVYYYGTPSWRTGRYFLIGTLHTLTAIQKM